MKRKTFFEGLPRFLGVIVSREAKLSMFSFSLVELSTNFQSLDSGKKNKQLETRHILKTSLLLSKILN